MKTLNLSSLALKTDLISLSREAQIREFEDCIAVISPGQPNFYWGNFLIFPSAPQSTDKKIWTRRYQEIFEKPNPHFYTLTWDSLEFSPSGIEEFTKDGFLLETDITLVASELKHPAKHNKEIQVRLIQSDEEFSQIPEVHYNPESKVSFKNQIAFMQKRIESFKKFSQIGTGFRFGAFLKGKLIGDLGIYHDRVLGRYNEIATHRDFYRRGVCQTLVYESGLRLKNELGLKQLVIVADAGYHALEVYKKVGFLEHEKNFSLLWYEGLNQ